MPNWTANTLLIAGPDETLNAAVADPVLDLDTQTYEIYSYENRYITLRNDAASAVGDAVKRFTDAAATIIADHNEEQD